MQLKLRRSQREGGVLSKTVVFCLDARAEYTSAEKQNILRYKLQNEVVYNSEASKRNLDASDKLRDGTTGGNLKSLGFALLANMKLNISISSLERGQHVECKSMDELLGAEEALISACKNLKQYLEAANTFDGREVLINFDAEEPSITASAVTPDPALVSSPMAPPIAPTPASATYDQQPAASPMAAEKRTAPAMDGAAEALFGGFSDLTNGKPWRELTEHQRKALVTAGFVLVIFLFVAMNIFGHHAPPPVASG